jgi:hypothetical protein
VKGVGAGGGVEDKRIAAFPDGEREKDMEAWQQRRSQSVRHSGGALQRAHMSGQQAEGPIRAART